MRMVTYGNDSPETYHQAGLRPSSMELTMLGGPIGSLMPGCAPCAFLL